MNSAPPRAPSSGEWSERWWEVSRAFVGTLVVLLVGVLLYTCMAGSGEDRGLKARERFEQRFGAPMPPSAVEPQMVWKRIDDTYEEAFRFGCTPAGLSGLTASLGLTAGQLDLSGIQPTHYGEMIAESNTSNPEWWRLAPLDASTKVFCREDLALSPPRVLSLWYDEAAGVVYLKWRTWS